MNAPMVCLDLLPTFAFLLGGMGVGEVILFGLIAVLLYGKRLPDVAKDFGKHYHKFKSGLQEIQSEMMRATSEVDRTVRETGQHLLSYDDDDEPTAPQFTASPEQQDASTS